MSLTQNMRLICIVPSLGLGTLRKPVKETQFPVCTQGFLSSFL